MRYSNTHREETRAKLLDQSRAIAKKDGFGTTGIDTLMASIGLSGGAFYRHFPTKEALFEELVTLEMQHSLEMLAGGDEASPAHLVKCLRSYLSTRHARSPDSGCVLPSLGPEIARSSPELRRKVEDQLTALKDAWAKRTANADVAWGLIAQCVGSVLLARVVEREGTQREIVAASRRFLSTALAADI